MTKKMRKNSAKTPNSRNQDGLCIPHNLTFEGYQEALRSLRKKDPTAARRLERYLEPILEKRGIFPRRRIPWHQTSQGARLRLALLPKNPHVREDIEQVRLYLGIPKTHIRPTSRDSFWKEASELVKPESVRMVVEGNFVAEWLYVHRTVAAGNEAPDKTELVGLLSKPMVESAVTSAHIDLTSPNAPDWLQRPLKNIRTQQYFTSPVDRATARMTERHQLPLHITPALTYYLLTLNINWVKDLELVEVEIDYSIEQGDYPGAFSIKLRGIDEYITAYDWSHIWKVYIKLRQESLWKQRGKNPQGRRTVGVNRLKKMMPLYNKIIRDGLTMQDAFYASTRFNDLETIRRGINDLKKLLSPKP